GTIGFGAEVAAKVAEGVAGGGGGDLVPGPDSVAGGVAVAVGVVAERFAVGGADARELAGVVVGVCQTAVGASVIGDLAGRVQGVGEGRHRGVGGRVLVGDAGQTV